jgi:L-amino acid N-acyltransferase
MIAVVATAPSVAVRLASVDDAEAIRRIYNVEVESGTATFDLVPRSLDDQRAILAARTGAHPILVAEQDGEIVGFGSLSAYRDRPA